MIKTILLFYCTLLALFINISGLVTSKQPQDYILQSFFLPVTIFLIYSSFKAIFNKKKEKKIEISPQGKPITAIVIFLFLLLLAFVARQTISQSEEFVSPLSTSLLSIPSITPTPTPSFPQKIIISSQTPNSLINIRQEPASKSAVLAKVKPGMIFPCLDFKEGWYKIKLANDKIGWVIGEFIKPILD